VNDELKQLLSRATADVPEVGRICFGLSRNASYAAAGRGDFPTIKVGRLLKVIVQGDRVCHFLPARATSDAKLQRLSSFDTTARQTDAESPHINR